MEAVQHPDQVDVAAIAAENQALRQQLLEENERLRKAVAESQASGLQVKGLTDEDVRRLEHPEEFVQAENEEFRARLAELEAQYQAVVDAKPPAAHEAPAPLQADSLSTLTDEELAAEVERRSAAAHQ